MIILHNMRILLRENKKIHVKGESVLWKAISRSRWKFHVTLKVKMIEVTLDVSGVVQCS
jgi:hypothetical protein